MRISELSATTDVPIGTIKYYLREGLLPAGRRSSRTTADYDEEHAERLRLIRALVETGGLGIAAVRRVIAVIDGPQSQRLDVLSTAQDALTGGGTGAEEAGGAASAAGSGGDQGMRAVARDVAGTAAGDGDSGSGPGAPVITDAEASRTPDARPVGHAHAWVAARGWPTGPGDPVVDRLEKAWAACEAAGIHVEDAMMADYADAVEQVARVDVAAVPPGADDAVRRVVIGTIMMEPVLSALRLLAQRHVSVRQAGAEASMSSR